MRIQKVETHKYCTEYKYNYIHQHNNRKQNSIVYEEDRALYDYVHAEMAQFEFVLLI